MENSGRKQQKSFFFPFFLCLLPEKDEEHHRKSQDKQAEQQQLVGRFCVVDHNAHQAPTMHARMTEQGNAISCGGAVLTASIN